MTQASPPRIDLEKLLKKAKPLITQTGARVLAMGRLVRTKLESLTFEEQLLARHNQLINMGLTEEQAAAVLKQSTDNILAKSTNANQEEEHHE